MNGQQRVILNHAPTMERAEADKLAKVNEILDEQTLPENIGQLRRLLLRTYGVAFLHGVLITSRRVKEWVPPEEFGPLPATPRQIASNELHRQNVEAAILREQTPWWRRLLAWFAP